ncbi:hypothetical protein SPRG_20282 [Saprolegnia parasitica CBS 223.65]|uniref:PX domain-containing protein n=1 Tax=Saprolegnia parasitica (strain CBS 223.65) TaxID=695850 RepID=A0A067CBJ3_SAPPC|nr:hypothetical protein SPRG_20282 [Saprolegnia parasitica CBS 223.65]KDO28124.1 hypothetical protein SPRG_20282 [Saprolegnia parasitica CBS 223.65]|eukprot:XP_012201263.1 hypothetical protein SPRG_20282 [Saprolegnia parasitica CBS 223.65]
MACALGFFSLLSLLTASTPPLATELFVDRKRGVSISASVSYSADEPVNTRTRRVSVAASVSYNADDASTRARRVSVAASVSTGAHTTTESTFELGPEDAVPSSKHANMPCATCQHVPVVYMLPIVLPCACHTYVGPQILPPTCCVHFPHCDCASTVPRKLHQLPSSPMAAMSVPPEYLSRRLEDYPMAIPTDKAVYEKTDVFKPTPLTVPELIPLPSAAPTEPSATRPRRDRSLFRARLWIGKAFEHEDGCDDAVYVMRVDCRTADDANVLSPTSMWDVTVTYQEFERLYQALIDEVDGEPVAIPALELSTLDEEDLWHRRRTALQTFVDALTSNKRLANADCLRKLCQMW